MTVDGQVSVVQTGAANVASVCAALRRIGAQPRLTRSAEELRTATPAILPGVGAFGPAMRRLADNGLDDALRERVRAGYSTCAICLGMQLFCDESEESPGVSGLGAITGHVARFPDAVRVPQLGWNLIETDAGCRLLRGGYAYFANSYRLEASPPGWAGARATHGAPFVAALERDGILACQFHPELSGRWGLDLLRRWLTGEERKDGGGC